MTIKTAERSWVSNLPKKRFLLQTSSLLFVFLVVLVLVPVSPAFQPIPGANSGHFLSMGSRILQGAALYRDLWDANFPLILYLNALGLLVGGQWGVWALQVSAVLGAAWMLFAYIRPFFGRLAAGIAVAGMLANLVFVLEQGNVPEEYALPLQVGAVLFFSRSVSQKAASAWSWGSVGVLIGLASSFRPTLLGTGVSLMLYLLFLWIWKREPARLVSMIWMGLGMGLVWGAWALFLWANGSLLPFWEQAIQYNLFYAGITHLDRLNAMQTVIQRLFDQSSFLLIAGLAWLAVLPFLFWNHSRFRAIVTGRAAGIFALLVSAVLLANGWIDDQTGRFFSLSSLSSYRLFLIFAGLFTGILGLFFRSGWIQKRLDRWFPAAQPVSETPLLLPLFIAWIDLPVQVVLAGTFGQKNSAYFLPVLPSLSVLFGFLIGCLLPSKDQNVDPVFHGLWTAVLTALTVLSALGVTVSRMQVSENPQIAASVQSVREQAAPPEEILVWGMEDRIYFLSGRVHPGEYGNLQPLFAKGYATDIRLDDFLEQLKADPPALLIHTRNDSLPLVLPAAQVGEAVNRSGCEQLLVPDFFNQQIRSDYDARGARWREEPLPYIPEQMGAVYQWLCQHYSLIDQVGPDEWSVYRYSPAAGTP